MSSATEPLHESLAGDPSNWSVRLTLLEQLIGQGRITEADDLLRDAPVAPDSERQLGRIVDLIGPTDHLGGLRQVIAWFLGAQPESAWARLTQARLSLRTGDTEIALAQYRSAQRRDPSLFDASLEALAAPPKEEATAPEPQQSVPARKRSTPPRPVPAKAVERRETPEMVSQTSEDPPQRDIQPVPPKAVAEELSPALPSADSNSPKAPASVKTKSSAREPSPTGSEKAPVSPDSEEARNLVVADGEKIRVHEKESDAKIKLSAVSVALVSHIAAGILLGLWVIAQPRPQPPQLISGTEVKATDDSLERQEIKKLKPRPIQTASAQMKVATAHAASTVAIPQIETNLTTFDPIGMGDSFGPSMSFGMGEDGGSVSFFGARSVARKVVFVVDFSASMVGTKDKLMRQELIKSLNALPAGVQYQLIFFGGPAWYAGQEVGEAGKYDQYVANVVKDGGNKFVWYEGWDESERHTGNRSDALYHYADGQDRLPRSNYIISSRSNISRSVQQIEETSLVFGTDWRWPLRMAMNMKPDTIFFMTDGAFGTSKGVSKKEMIDDLLEYNRRNSNARINTICMMVLQARTELEQLAEGSRGEFTLVLEDGTSVRGSQLDRQ